jgi:molybdopterin synthase catalytic subunit/molybdopterin converting factor small subunit
MQVTIRLFAALRELAASELVEEFEGDAVSLAELRTRLAERHPALRPHLERVAIAVNEEYARSDAPPLRDGDRVALINPVAGGAATSGAVRKESSDETPAVLVTGEPLNARAMRDLVRTDASGAIVLFEGVVRDHHEGHAVERLEYEAYAEMAEREIARVIEEVRADAEADGHPLHRVAVHHRVGALDVGDPAIVAAVSAAHREEAFRAAARLVDRVKETAPIWKREWGPGGATWQDGVTPQP